MTYIVNNLQLFDTEPKSCKAQKDCWKKPRQLEFNHNDTFSIVSSIHYYI